MVAEINKENMQEFDCFCQQAKSMTLCNAIIQCMHKNHMTLENLYEAVQDVKKHYYKHAIVVYGSELKTLEDLKE